MVNDLRFVHRCFQQSCIENRLTLISESLCDLLAHACAFEGQVLISESLLCELEDVPLATAETRWLSIVTNLHWTKETRDQFSGKAIVLEILLSCKTNITASAKTVDVFTSRARHCREVSLALKLLVDVVDLQLRISLVLSVVRDTLSTVVSGVDHDHCQRDTTSFNKLLAIVGVILFDFAIVDIDLAGVLILQSRDGKLLASLFAESFCRDVLCFQTLFEVFGSHAAVLFLRGDGAVNLGFSGKKFFAFGALEEHFALNEIAEHLQTCLSHL